MPGRRLTARQVVRYLRGTKHVAFGTVNERGQPRVAPFDGIFTRGRLTVSTGGRRRAYDICAPTRRAARRTWTAVPSASSSTATRRSSGATTSVDELEPVWREIYGSSPFDWGEGGVFMRIEPTSMWAYAFHPEDFPE